MCECAVTTTTGMSLSEFAGAHELQDLLPGNAGQVEVQQDDVGRLQTEPFQRVAAVHHDVGAITGDVKHVAEQGGDIPVVFDDQSQWFFHAWFPESGPPAARACPQ